MKLTTENSNTTTKWRAPYIVHYIRDRERFQTQLEDMRKKREGDRERQRETRIERQRGRQRERKTRRERETVAVFEFVPYHGYSALYRVLAIL